MEFSLAPSKVLQFWMIKMNEETMAAKELNRNGSRTDLEQWML